MSTSYTFTHRSGSLETTKRTIFSVRKKSKTGTKKKKKKKKKVVVVENTRVSLTQLSKNGNRLFAACLRKILCTFFCVFLAVPRIVCYVVNIKKMNMFCPMRSLEKKNQVQRVEGMGS